MADARMIRAGLLDSERLLKCSPPERWLYLNILFEADDIGLFEATAFKLARKADLPREGDEPERMLQALVQRDLIRLYMADGKRYGFVPRFGQRLQITRMRKPVPPLSVVFDDMDAINKINKLGFSPTVEPGGSTVETVNHGLKKKKKEKKNTPPSPSVMDPPKGVEPAKAEGEGRAPKTPKTPTRGTRLPADWKLPQSWGTWALAEFPHWTADIVREIGASFGDHWHAATGRGATKMDWPATWRNWCRSDIQQRKHPKAGKQQTAFAAERTAQADRIMGSYAAEVRAADNQQPSFIDMEAFDAPRLTDG